MLHPLEEVLGRDDVLLVPAIRKERCLESAQVHREGDTYLVVLLQHQPCHHQLPVEVLSRSHDLYSLTLLQSHLVQVEDLRHEVAGHLPRRVPVQEITDIGV